MDENEFRSTYNNIREFPCVFEKAILNRHCDCSRVRRIALGEREGCACTELNSHNRCKSLLSAVRENARFVVKATASTGPLPHAKEVRVQVGGLHGLNTALDADRSAARVEDVDALLDEAINGYGSVDALPFQAIVQGIASFKGRRRSDHGRG